MSDVVCWLTFKPGESRMVDFTELSRQFAIIKRHVSHQDLIPVAQARYGARKRKEFAEADQLAAQLREAGVDIAAMDKEMIGGQLK